MADKKISYTNRTFEEYRAALINLTKEYYPSIADKFDDASIGSWFVDLVAAIGDNLSYHLDRVFAETNIDTANERSSVMAIARSNGLKIPGPKASVAVEEFSCLLPIADVNNPNNASVVGMPNWAYAPVLKKGTKITNGTQYFELMEDIDFAEQVDSNGVSDRNYWKVYNGGNEKYKVTKIAAVYAGETKIYSQVINSSDIKPFMEIILPDTDVISVESIIFKDGTNFNGTPLISEFMNQNEYVPATDSPSKVDTYRFFEVNSLVEQYRWGDDISTTRIGNQNVGQPVTYTYGYMSNEGIAVPVAAITKGQWIPLTQKFITEYTDNGYLKITFGAGEEAGQQVDYETNNPNEFTKYQISKMIRNNFLGKTPRGGWTMYVQYRVGGGVASNVAKGRINEIAYLNSEIGRCISSSQDSTMISEVLNSVTCTNITPSVSGKDAPSVEEIKQLIKYNNASQERCVTLQDYVARVHMMPARYGSPFRITALEANNKVMLYILGINNEGKLSDEIPEQLSKNIENYLSMYRSINDFVEIKVGRIINLSFECDLFIDKTYDATDVIRNVMETIKDYMDINKHQLGEPIYVSDLERAISDVDGVNNIIDLRIYNEYGRQYSNSRTSQGIIADVSDAQTQRSLIDLEDSRYVLNSNVNEMFEIKYPDNNIIIRAMQQ